MRKAGSTAPVQKRDPLKVAATMTIDDIGTTAGKIWGYLVKHGKVSLSALERGVDVPHDLSCMAIGWLARESKVGVTREKRSIQIWLT